MTSLEDSARAQALPAPVPRRGAMPLFEFFRTLRDNVIATYPEDAYERDIVERKISGEAGSSSASRPRSNTCCWTMRQIIKRPRSPAEF